VKSQEENEQVTKQLQAIRKSPKDMSKLMKNPFRLESRKHQVADIGAMTKRRLDWDARQINRGSPIKEDFRRGV